MSKTTLDKVLSREFLSIDDEMVPGTIYLVDLEGVLNVKKDEGGAHNIILQPQPSSNPNDPLRWPKKKKVTQFALLWFWAFMQVLSLNWSAPAWMQWTVEFNCTFFQLSITVALAFLFLGFGCLFLQPTALKLGKRFVYLICTVLVIIANIIGSQGNTVQILYVVKLFAFTASPVDSLVEISTTDVFYQHERALYLSMMVMSIYAGTALGPVACGYIIDKYSWRWCYYIQIIIYGVLLVVQLFYMEDTTFARLERINVEEDILQQIKSREDIFTAIKSGDLSQEHSDNDKKLKVIISTAEVEGQSDSEIDSLDNTIPKRTYWQRMRLMETEYNDPRTWFTIFYRPFFLITFPAVIWAGIIYGSQMMWLALLATTQSKLYSPPPYSFSAPQVGLTNLSSFIGSASGMLYSGPFVDWITIKLSKRNKGIFEPECRLWTMIIPTVFNACGLLAYSLGPVYGAHWFVSVGVGQFLVGFAMSSQATICLTYCVDSYPKLASEAFVLILFVRNMIGCGFTFAIDPWVSRNGLALTTWLMFMLSIIFNSSFIVMLKWGKNFRRFTKEKYLRLSVGSDLSKK